MHAGSAIYQIRHLQSGKLYVGSAVNFRLRVGLHKRRLRRGLHHSAKLQRAWDKYGETAFVFEVLELVPDVQQLTAREQAWIDRLDAVQSGYNVAPAAGSLLGFRHTTETRARMAQAHTGKPKSPEHVAKVKEALTGRSMTAEQREKMRAAKLGKKREPHSAATRAKMSASRTGAQFSSEHRAKLAAAKIGRKLSPETRAKMSASHKARHAPPPP